MSDYVRNVKIFIASPMDVNKEREMAEQVVNEVNKLIGSHLGIQYQIKKWETGVISEMGRPQEVINRQLEPQNCDLFLGILWSRFGMPTGGRDDTGNDYDSGTSEEFSLAYKSWKRSRKPHIMFYRCTKKIRTIDLDIEQNQKVNEFFDEFKHDKSHPGLITEYDSHKTFELSLRRALVEYAFNQSNISSEADFRNKVELGKYFLEQGIQKMFLPSTNAERDEAKIEALKKAHSIKLVSNAGYSFIAHFGNIFRDIITERLKKGCEFKIILANPWCEAGVLVATGNTDGKMLINSTNRDQNGIIGFNDPVNLVEQSSWYHRKHTDSIMGYEELRDKYDGIELRVTKFYILSSVLIVDEQCFIEPYLGLTTLDRQDKNMLTFELNASSNSELYKYMKDYFDLIWILSDTYEDYKKNIDEYKSRLNNLNVNEIL